MQWQSAVFQGSITARLGLMPSSSSATLLAWLAWHIKRQTSRLLRAAHDSFVSGARVMTEHSVAHLCTGSAHLMPGWLPACMMPLVSP